MAVQIRTNNSTVPTILESSLEITRDDGVFFTNAARAADVVFGTLLAKILATGKLTTYTDETATNGTAVPVGIYVGEDIPFADIVAGDVEGIKYLKGGSLVFNKDHLVIENAKTLDTVIATGTINARTVEDELNSKGIFFQEADAISGFENT